MNKERKVTETNAVVIFDGDVCASELNLLLYGFHGDAIIKGEVLLNESLNVECNLFVYSVIAAQDKVTSINVRGDLFLYATNCCHITVSGDVYCLDLNKELKEYIEVEINSEEICVGGILYCEGNIIAKNIEVGEGVDCDLKNIKSPSLNIYIARTNTNIEFERVYN